MGKKRNLTPDLDSKLKKTIDIIPFVDETRTGFAAIQHLWEQRFGKPLKGHRQLLNFLSAECGFSYQQAQALSFADCAKCIKDFMLQTDSVVPVDVIERNSQQLMDVRISKLNDTCRKILEVIPFEQYLIAKEIEELCPVSLASVKGYIAPSGMLGMSGLIEKHKAGIGYRRVKNINFS